MLKMVLVFQFFFLYLALTVAGQESVELLTLYGSSQLDLQALSHKDLPIAVSVENEHLNEVSSSILMAEKWVRIHVLSRFPAANITTIVVGHTLLCNKNQEDELGLILPAIKNLYHSLTRWGLEKEIKVSASFSSNCLHPSSATYTVDLADSFIKPILSFLQVTNSTYLVNPTAYMSSLSYETMNLVTSHSESMKNLGISNLNNINVIITSTKESKPTSRKLSFMDSKIVDPCPARPTPLLAPSHSPNGWSVPAYGTQTPLPPLIGEVSPPPSSLPFTPELPPLVGPASPPYGPNLPPCNPLNGDPAAAPVAGRHNGLWCVAKPSVPAETLQEAIDYACGEGDVDCEAIKPHGSCYSPDTLVAHASYAFNSYWQKNKRNGGTCGFGGTAMLINSDPSYRHCRFILF